MEEYRGERKFLWKQETGVSGNHSQAFIGTHLYFLALLKYKQWSLGEIKTPSQKIEETGEAWGEGGSKIGTQGQECVGKYPDFGMRCPKSQVICSLTCLGKYLISLSTSFPICEMRVIIFAYVTGFLGC